MVIKEFYLGQEELGMLKILVNGSYQSQFYDVAGDSEGNIYTVGHSPNPGTTQCGIIMKFDSGGTVVWSRFIEHTNGATYVLLK